MFECVESDELLHGDVQPSKQELMALESESEEDHGEVLCAVTSADDPLICLKRAIGPLLRREEEFDLAVKIKKGDRDALDKLVSSNLSLVIKIAKSYYEGHLKFLDYVQEGCVGLTIAAKKFDGDRNIKFITYANWWIRQCIGRAIANHNKTVRSPARHIERINKMRRVIRHFTAVHGYEPSPAEIAHEMECDEKTILSLFSEMEDTVSLNTPLDGEDGVEFADMLVADSETSPERRIQIKEMEDAYEAYFEKLSETEKEIFMQERSARVSVEEKKGMSRQLIYQYRKSIQKKMADFCHEHLR